MTANGIKLDSDEVRDFCRKWKIKELRVFGSVLRGDFGPDSDVDFLAEFEEDEEWDLFDEVHMQDELSSIIGRRCEMISRYAIDTDSNRRFRESVLSSSETVYAR